MPKALIYGLIIGTTLGFILSIGYWTDNYVGSLTAIGTLTLAFFTFRAIKESREAEKRRRNDDLAKESRDRKIVLLNDIIKWAEEVVSAPFLGTSPTDIDIRNIVNRYRTLWSKHSNIIDTASTFNDQKLNEIVSNILKSKGSFRKVAIKLAFLDILTTAIKIKAKDISKKSVIIKAKDLKEMETGIRELRKVRKSIHRSLFGDSIILNKDTINLIKRTVEIKNKYILDLETNI